MAKYVSKVVTFEGRQYLVIKLHERWDYFYGQEVGRNFVTLIPFDVVA